MPKWSWPRVRQRGISPVKLDSTPPGRGRGGGKGGKGGGGGTIPVPLVDNGSTKLQNDQATSWSWNHTCNGNSRLLVVAVSYLSSAERTVSVTYNTVAMTFLTKAGPTGGNNSRIWMFYLVNPAAGAHAVAVTLNLAPGLAGQSGQAVSLTKVHQLTPVGTPATEVENVVRCTSLPVVSAIGELCIDAIIMASASDTISPTAPSQPQTSLTNTTSFTVGTSTQLGAVSNAMEWCRGGLTTSGYAHVAVSVKVA